MNKDKVNKILNEVITEIIPDKNSLEYANNFVKELNDLIKLNNIDAVAVLGGSMAKNTFLKNDYDADIFVKFSTEYKGKNISKLLEQILKNNFEYERVKGSRDYFHVQKKFLFELVPVLDVSNIADAENVIDMSPLHVNYFKSKGKGLENEVRLLKRFMKANRVYGAESFINGFSGHVVDLLIVKYRSFLDVLKIASKWKKPVIIDIEKKLKDPLMELDKAKISGPLILVDPVQENRNAAAALSFECFNSFIKSSKEFLSEPSKDFFVFKTAKELINKNKDNKNDDEEFIYELKINPLKGNKDIAGTKILKLLEHIIRELKKHDFIVKEFKWDFGYPSEAYFLIANETLDLTKIVKGPPLNVKNHCDAFKKKHEDVFEKENFLFAKVNRKFTNVPLLFKQLIKDEYVLERCDSISFNK